MGNIIKLNQDWIGNARGFLEDVENNNVTHGVIIYRVKDGEIVFRRFAEDHDTYLIGLLVKGAIRLGMKAEWDGDE